MISLDLLKNLNNDEKSKIRQKQNNDTYNKLFYVAIIYSIMGIVYFITDLSTKYYAEPWGVLDLTAVLLLMISSISICIVTRIFKDKLINYSQWIASFYFLIINTVMLLFLTADLKNNKPDFLICFFNFVLINFIIYFNVILSIVTELAALIASLAIIIAFTNSEALLINVEQASIILVGTIAIQHYLRTIVTKSFIKELNIEQISKEFEVSSTIDFLTKLGNRKGLDMFINNEVNRAIEAGSNISASMLDIDDFKSYNDHYSHMTGDQCLKLIGSNLNSLPNNKFHAFRYGGEEFLLIGLDCDLAELNEMNKAILKGVRALKIDRSKTGSEIKHITVSIGSAIKKLDTINDFKDLLELADSRLYKSKRNGKNRITME